MHHPIFITFLKQSREYHKHTKQHIEEYLLREWNTYAMSKKLLKRDMIKSISGDIGDAQGSDDRIIACAGYGFPIIIIDDAIGRSDLISSKRP